MLGYPRHELHRRWWNILAIIPCGIRYPWRHIYRVAELACRACGHRSRSTTVPSNRFFHRESLLHANRLGFLMPACLARLRYDRDFSATSSAFLSGRHHEQVTSRFFSLFCPPLIRARTCSQVHFSPAVIFLPQRWHRPFLASNTRRRTRGGTGVSSVSPRHSGTDLMRPSPLPVATSARQPRSVPRTMRQRLLRTVGTSCGPLPCVPGSWRCARSRPIRRRK
jgi:hypothetical protein